MADLKKLLSVCPEEMASGFGPLAKYLGIGNYLQTVDNTKAASNYRKIFMYVVSPIAFGRTYQNPLLSKIAKQINLSRTGPFNALNHSSTTEKRALQLTSLTMNIIFTLNQLELSLLFKANGIDFKHIMAGTNPRELLNFGRERASALGFPPEWVMDDETTLLFSLVFLIVNDDSLLTKVLTEVNHVQSGHSEEMDRLFIAGTRAHNFGCASEMIRFAEQGLTLNPFSEAMYGTMWYAYMTQELYEYACWCASREVMLNGDHGLGYLHWIISAELLGNVEAATLVCEALFKTGLIETIYLDVESYRDLTARYVRLTKRDVPPRTLAFRYVDDPNGIQTAIEHDLKMKRKITIARGVSKMFEMTGRFCPLPENKCLGTLDTIKKATDPFLHLYANENMNYVALKDNYGFIPFQWITVFPHDDSIDYNNEEKSVLHAWFVGAISPMALNINYTHPLLGSWVDSLGILKSFLCDSHRVSAVAEDTLLKLTFQVYNFVIFDKRSLKITEQPLLSLYGTLDPRVVIAEGRKLLSKMFGHAVPCLEDDMHVLAFLALMLIGSSTRLSRMAYGNAKYHGIDKPNVLRLRQSAKDAIIAKKYDDALRIYKEALVISPYDPIIYGNIAQVFIEMKKYELARWYALRAIWLNPSEPKSHYRWCKATALRGLVKEALAVTDAIMSCMSQSTNSSDVNSLWKEVYTQREYILNLNKPSNKVNNNDDTTYNKRRLSDCKDSANAKSGAKPNKKNVGRVAEAASHKVEKVKEGKVTKADNLPTENGGDNSNNKFVADNSSQRNEKKGKKAAASSDLKGSNLSVFLNYLGDGSKQLVGNLYKSAAENYAAAMEILRNTSRKELHLTEIDEALFKYCYAKACMRRHTYEHIWKAIEMFDEILEDYNIPLPMVYYGKGLAYVSLNRFMDSIEPLEKALQVLEKTKIHLEVHVHPGLTGEVIKESSRDHLLKAVVDLLANCHSPPSPDATCHVQNSKHGDDPNHSTKIYCDDPEFQGYVRATCRERCRIEFHPKCYKKIADELKIHGDKAMIGHRCLTPDCASVFVKFQIFGSDGLVRKTLDEQVETKVKATKPQSKNKNKARNEPIKKDFNFKKRPPAAVPDSNGDNDNEIGQRRERSRSTEPKIETAVAASPDMRSAENALLVLKKDSDLNQVAKKPAARIKRQPLVRPTHKDKLRRS